MRIDFKRSLLLMDRLHKFGVLAVCDTEEASPVAFLNLYEPGDAWIKIQGCDVCTMESRKRCCGNCAFLMERGCAWHFEKGDNTRAKPFVCVVRPFPNTAKGFCQLEYECVSGKHRGKVRRVRDRDEEFIDGSAEFRSRSVGDRS